MRDPRELYVEHAFSEAAVGGTLVFAFTGFIDAGNALRDATAHLLDTCEHRLLATFDPDEILDYRARRPAMTYVVDHFVSVDIPQLSVHEVVDEAGTAFLLLEGPEPDYQWQRFLAAVDLIVDRYQVTKSVGLTSVPWPVPHTRPLGLVVHGSEPELVAGTSSPVGEVQVPGHVAAMLELNLGERGVPSMGLTAQVPHYLVQFDYPRAAISLLNGLEQTAGLSIDIDLLLERAEAAERDVAEQTEGNDEFTEVVAALEAQYDQLAEIAAGSTGGLADLAELADQGMLSGDEIAAQVEQFLSSLEDPDDPGKQVG